MINYLKRYFVYIVLSFILIGVTAILTSPDIAEKVFVGIMFIIGFIDICMTVKLIIYVIFEGE